MNALATYILGLFLLLSPIKGTDAPDKGVQTIGGISEEPDARLARYTEMAMHLAEVIDEAQRLPFAGPHAKAQTAAYQVALAYHESHFALSVDKNLGKYARGDNGKSWCQGQINLGIFGKSVEGWTGQDLIDDRKKCYRAQLRVLSGSIGRCASLGPYAKLSGYTAGKCYVEEPKAKERQLTAMRIFRTKKNPPPSQAVLAREKLEAEKAKVPAEVPSVPAPKNDAANPQGPGREGGQVAPRLGALLRGPWRAVLVDDLRAA